MLHQLQRAVLIALGLTGKYPKNVACKTLLRKHNRIVLLSHQSRAVNDGIREEQASLLIPTHKVLSTVTTMVTRWGNQLLQLRSNNTLKPIIEPVLRDYKSKNRQKPNRKKGNCGRGKEGK